MILPWKRGQSKIGSYYVEHVSSRKEEVVQHPSRGNVEISVIEIIVNVTETLLCTDYRLHGKAIVFTASWILDKDSGNRATTFMSHEFSCFGCMISKC